MTRDEIMAMVLQTEAEMENRPQGSLQKYADDEFTTSDFQRHLEKNGRKMTVQGARARLDKLEQMGVVICRVEIHGQLTRRYYKYVQKEEGA